MLEKELVQIGNKIQQLRKKSGLTQAEVADRAGMSDRAYADIERGCTNMRIETMLKICDVLSITPNDIFVKEDTEVDFESIRKIFEECDSIKRNQLLKMMQLFLNV